MLERLYTTKMSADKKSLQKRFSKIRSKSGRISKLMALIIFAAILLVMACVTIIIAIKINPNGYYMTGNEFYDYINRPIGAVMADIDYADDNKIVFHHAEGLFIDNLQTEEIEHSVNLKRLDIACNQQGSSVLEIKVDKTGKYAYLSTIGPADEIKGYKKYIINLDTGKVKRGDVPEGALMFAGLADTSATVENPGGFYSRRCVTDGNRIYYLTTETGQIRDIKLVTIDTAAGRIADTMYLFKEENISRAQRKSDLIHSTLSANEEIAVNSGMSWNVDKEIVELVFDKLNETRQMPHVDIKEQVYDITTYIILEDERDYPVLYLIDEDMELVFSMTLSKDEYFEINKLVYNHTRGGLSYMDNAEIALRNFFDAFSKSDFDAMKDMGTENLPIDTVLKICYGLTKAELISVVERDSEEYLSQYLQSDEHKLLSVLSAQDIELLGSGSDVLKVYGVVIRAESNIKGEVKPPFERSINVICRKQADSGKYLVDSFTG